MYGKQPKSNIEKLVMSKNKLRVGDLLHTSRANEVLDKVSRLSGLKHVIVITHSDSGEEVFWNCDTKWAIFQLEVMKARLVNDYLYSDDEED